MGLDDLPAVSNKQTRLLDPDRLIETIEILEVRKRQSRKTGIFISGVLPTIYALIGLTRGNLVVVLQALLLAVIGGLSFGLVWRWHERKIKALEKNFAELSPPERGT